MCHSLTEVTEVPGKGMGILQNFPTFRVEYGDVTALTQVPGIAARGYRTHVSYTKFKPVPRVFLPLTYRTSKSSGYGYEYRTELPGVPGTRV